MLEKSYAMFIINVNKYSRIDTLFKVCQTSFQLYSQKRQIFDGRQNHSGIQRQTSPHAAHSHSLPANRRDNDLLQGMCATNIILNDTSCEYQAKFRSCVSVQSTHIWQSAKGRIWVCVWERGLSLFPRPKFLGRVPDEEIGRWKERLEEPETLCGSTACGKAYSHTILGVWSWSLRTASTKTHTEAHCT